MTSRESIELALRAAQVARRVLELLGVSDREVASLIIKEAANSLMELDKWWESSRDRP